MLIALLLLSLKPGDSHAGDTPVLDPGGSSEPASTPAAGGTMTGSGPGSRESIMPELPAKMPEADALAEDERISGDFAFERLKLLEGTWAGTAGSGSEASPVEVTWELSAAGTALIERQFAGTNNEMMSIYHRDGRDLVMTHYCAMGNQPRMRFDAGESVSNLYTFRFNGGTNIGRNETHVHAGTIQFVNANQIRAEWMVYSGSKRVGSNVFDLKRTPGS